MLIEKQFEFARKISVLRLVAFEIGYQITDGDAYRDPRVTYGSSNSCHRLRLAQDLNIFKDGEFLTGVDAEKAHSKLHDIWDMMGGAKRILGDLNHYSLEYNGQR